MKWTGLKWKGQKQGWREVTNGKGRPSSSASNLLVIDGNVNISMNIVQHNLYQMYATEM